MLKFSAAPMGGGEFLCLFLVRPPPPQAQGVISAVWNEENTEKRISLLLNAAFGEDA